MIENQLKGQGATVPIPFLFLNAIEEILNVYSISEPALACFLGKVFGVEKRLHSLLILALNILEIIDIEPVLYSFLHVLHSEVEPH